MRLLAWNILHGGGARIPRIVEEISAHDPDVIALTGFRSDTRLSLRSDLKYRGWAYVETSNPAERINGIALFSRTPIRRAESAAPPGHSFRWLDVYLPEEGIGLGVLQIMAAVGSLKGPAAVAKRQFWDAVLAAAETRLDTAFLFTGMWNTGLHRIDEKGKTYVCADHFARLSAMGWIDLWRHFHPGVTEWTWYSSQKNGFRVDHAFASPSLLGRVRACRYSHVEREARISDHSLILVEVE
jgi:exonuclease III